jgi:hypothetical protein
LIVNKTSALVLIGKSEGADKHLKNDYQIFSNGKNINFETFEGESTVDLFFNGLQRCFEVYYKRVFYS